MSAAPAFVNPQAPRAQKAEEPDTTKNVASGSSFGRRAQERRGEQPQLSAQRHSPLHAHVGPHVQAVARDLLHAQVERSQPQGFAWSLLMVGSPSLRVASMVRVGVGGVHPMKQPQPRRQAHARRHEQALHVQAAVWALRQAHEERWQAQSEGSWFMVVTPNG